MNNPFISVIIPFYNSREYISDCLRSIELQDYQGDIECILIDDCSTDGSREIVERYIDTRQSRVLFRVLHQDQNRKQSTARNWGMHEAKGDYIFFLDSDDWIEPSTLSKMVEVLNRYPKSQIVQAGIRCTQEGAFRWLSVASWNEPKREYADDRQWIIDTCAIRLGMIPMTPVCKLMSRKFIEEHHLQFVENIFHEDEPWLVLIAKHLQYVSFCHEDLYNYRQHANSTTSGGTMIYFEDRCQSWMEIFKLFDDRFCPLMVLRQIDIDTSKYFVKKTRDPKMRRKLVGIKFKLMRYCPLRAKVRILAWVVLHSYQLF